MSYFRGMGLDLLALVLFAACVLAGLSLASYQPSDPPGHAVYPTVEEPANLCGPAGATFAHYAMMVAGLASYYLLFEGLVYVGQIFLRRRRVDPFAHVIGGLLLFLGLATSLSLFVPTVGTTALTGSGGWIGTTLGMVLSDYFSRVGSTILVGTFLLAGLTLSGNMERIAFVLRVASWPFRVVLGGMRAIVLAVLSPFLRKGREIATEADDEEEEMAPVPIRRNSRENERDEEPATILLQPELEEASPVEEEISNENEPVEESPSLRVVGYTDEKEIESTETTDKRTEDEPAVPEPPAPAAIPRPIRINPPATLRRPHVRGFRATPQPLTEIDLPELDLLDEAEEFPYEMLAERARAVAETLERTFQEFRLNVHVTEIDTGPVVTQYELNLEKGLRVNKVAALADDLAIALRVPAVRVVSPIPGKNTVGVEVPNDKQVMVRLKELIEGSQTESKKCRIPIFLGKDVSGHPLVVDLTKMPHLLIAGRTGTGKSVCLNTLIMSILMTRSPDDVRMLMIDPKMVELSPYKRVPHLMHPVITDMKKAEAVLSWAVDKMEERYDMLARCGVRHLDNYNALTREERLRRMGLSELEEEAESVPERMPYIVIIADEMADMMMTSGKDVEGHIIRLAQKSRAVGIHLVLATQKPTVDVITGLIKSNLPARISFQVASRTDSRVVLDEMGADRLLGNGDMLYLAPATSHLIRAQGTYTSGEEIDRVIDFYSDVEPQYSEELARLNTSGAKGAPGASRDRDDLYDQAVDVVVREGRGSTSLLQRALGIGYGRAARLIDFMAEDGIVGDYNGSQAREVLFTVGQWEAIRNGGAVESA